MPESQSQIYRVVKNHEEQYSIWLSSQDLPLGWDDVGISGTRDECLDWIGTHWTDMRPLSVRRFEEGLRTRSAGGIDAAEGAER